MYTNKAQFKRADKYTNQIHIINTLKRDRDERSENQLIKTQNYQGGVGSQRNIS